MVVVSVVVVGRESDCLKEVPRLIVIVSLLESYIVLCSGVCCADSISCAVTLAATWLKLRSSKA